MPKHNLESIQEILASESWRGFDALELTELQDSVQSYVDAGYDEHGESYSEVFQELKAECESSLTELTKEWADSVSTKRKVQVLDVGAGHGVRTAFIAKQPRINLKAIEPSDYFYARHLLEMERDGTLPFGCAMKGDMCNLPFESAVFDAVYCNAVLHHQLYLPGKDIGIEKAFSEFSRVLLRGGHLYLLTIYGHHHHFRLDRFFQSLDEEMMEKLAKRNMLKINHMQVVESRGPFGENTRWLEVKLEKR